LSKGYKYIEQVNKVEEKPLQYGFVSRSEDEKLKEDIFRPDMEKLQLFTHMLRMNAALNKAIITHTK
jgi:hypothetical protein